MEITRWFPPQIDSYHLMPRIRSNDWLASQGVIWILRRMLCKKCASHFLVISIRRDDEWSCCCYCCWILGRHNGRLAVNYNIMLQDNCWTTNSVASQLYTASASEVWQLACHSDEECGDKDGWMTDIHSCCCGQVHACYYIFIHDPRTSLSVYLSVYPRVCLRVSSILCDPSAMYAAATDSQTDRRTVCS